MQHALPLVTIVTPSYNQGRFIRDTIESVLSQDYSHLEYFVIDGGSSDETVTILNSYGSHLFWLSEPDRGQAHAVNKGWRHGKGEIVGWLNSDDVYLPGTVRKAVDYLIQHPGTAMVYGQAYYMAEDGQLMGSYPTEPFETARLIDRCSICQPTVFIRRSVLDDVGYLNESLNFCIDYDLWIRISRKYAIGYLPEFLAKSRLHDNCKTVRDRVATHKEALETVHRYYGFVPPSWLGGYTREVLSRYFDRTVCWQRALFMLGMAAFGGAVFVKYNCRLPLSEFGHWTRGLLDGIKKLWISNERP